MLPTHKHVPACIRASPTNSACFGPRPVNKPLVARCAIPVQREVGVPVSEAERVSAIRAEVTRRIKEAGRAGRAKEAVRQLAEMARLGVQPDTLAATALIDACARNGKMDMAQSVFEELFEELLQPDDVTFSVLVRGYGGTEPPQWTAISGLLGLMDHKYKQKPSTVLYNAMLEICARTKDDVRGYEVIERMSRGGVRPNELTLDAVRNRKSLRSHLKRTFGSIERSYSMR